MMAKAKKTVTDAVTHQFAWKTGIAAYVISAVSTLASADLAPQVIALVAHVFGAEHAKTVTLLLALVSGYIALRAHSTKPSSLYRRK